MSSIELDHFQRTDVDWKPAVQLRAGDRVAGQNCSFLVTAAVTVCNELENRFEIHAMIEHADGSVIEIKIRPERAMGIVREGDGA